MQDREVQCRARKLRYNVRDIMRLNRSEKNKIARNRDTRAKCVNKVLKFAVHVSKTCVKNMPVGVVTRP